MAADGARPRAPKGTKKLIKSTVTVHDRTQIETVFDYYLLRSGQPKVPSAGVLPRRSVFAEQLLHYQVDVFLFYPRQFGLDAVTYPKNRFFSDMRPLLRFREPKLGYKAMMGQKLGTRSPLLFLKGVIAELGSGKAQESPQNIADEARLFACAFVGALMRGVDRSRKRFARTRTLATGAADERQRCRERVAKLLEKSHTVLLEYRALLASAEVKAAAQLDTVLADLRLVDEYCYYRMRDACAFLLLMTDAADATTAECDTFTARVLAIVGVHDEHAASRGYLLVNAASAPGAKERYLHRRGELKRRVWSVLFLETRAQPFFALQRQVGAMLAAGLASIWYAFVQILLLFQMLQPRQMRDIWGMSGVLFLSAAAMAYIVKDRIKEFGRGYFGAGVLRKIPDHSERLNYRDRTGRTVVVGAIKEWARYLDIAKLPPEVSRIRRAFGYDHACADETLDHVMHYTKEITLSGRLRILDSYPLRAVHDILRLNIDACLPRLGEPDRALHVVDSGGKVSSVRFPKVYFLDLALSYSRKDRGGKPLEQAFDYFRLVLDKNGLLRVERLS